MNGFLIRALLVVFAWLVLAFLLIPVFVVVPMSFSASNYLQFPPSEWSLRWYQAFFGSFEWMRAAKNSLIVAIATVLIATPIGFLAAYKLHRTEGWPHALLFGWLLGPQLMPVILLSIGVFFLYIRLNLVDTFAGIVLADVALAVPFVLTTCMAGLARVDHHLEFAARSLGASKIRAIIDVVIPQMKISLFAGALFAFVSALDEVVIGLLIAGGDRTILTRQMFMSLREQIDPTIAAVSSLLIMISLIAVAMFVVTQHNAIRRTTNNN